MPGLSSSIYAPAGIRAQTGPSTAQQSVNGRSDTAAHGMASSVQSLSRSKTLAAMNVEELREEYGKVRKALEDKTKQYIQVASVQQRLKDICDEEKEALNQEIKKRDEEKEALNWAIRRRDEELERLRKVCQANDAKRALENVMLQQELENTKGEADKLGKGYQNKLITCTQAKAVLDREMKAKDEELEKLREECQDKDEACAKEKSDLEREIENQINGKMREINNMSEWFSKCKEEWGNKEREYEEKVKELQDMLVAAGSNEDSNSQELEKTKEALRKAQREIKDLTEHIELSTNNCNAEKSFLQKTIEVLQARIEDLKEEKDHFQTQNSCLQEDFEKLRASIRSLMTDAVHIATRLQETAQEVLESAGGVVGSAADDGGHAGDTERDECGIQTASLPVNRTWRPDCM